MIHCLSCYKYPYDSKVIPSGSKFQSNVFKVYLISKELPNLMTITGADIEELPNDCKFAVGSKLYVINGNDGSEVYTWDSEKFVLFTVNEYSPAPDEPESDLVNIGRVDYAIVLE